LLLAPRLHPETHGVERGHDMLPPVTSSAGPSAPTVMPFQLRRLGRKKRSNPARSLSLNAQKRTISAAIATSAARVAPSSHFTAMPSPSPGNAAQTTPSAPVLTN